MKKIIFCLLILVLATSCNSEGNTKGGSEGSTPTAIDTSSQHPNGVTNGSVISTDTASMNTSRMVDSNKAN